MLDFIYKQAAWYSTRAEKIKAVCNQYEGIPRVKLKKQFEGLAGEFQRMAKAFSGLGQAFANGLSAARAKAIDEEQLAAHKLKALLQTLEIDYNWYHIENFVRETRYKFAATPYRYPGNAECYRVIAYLLKKGFISMPVILTIAGARVNKEIDFSNMAQAMGREHYIDYCRPNQFL